MELSAGASLFDSHCHLQDERILADFPAVCGRAKKAGVAVLSCCGSFEGDWQSVNALQADGLRIIPSFGLHPWYIAERTVNWDETLMALLRENPAAGVGEIGIDHALDKSTFADQETVFLRQLAIAAELERPVTIHCRRAMGRLVELLRQAGGVFQGGIVHSYSGPPELVKIIEGFGLSMSFSGSLTFPGNKRSAASIRKTSLDRLCIETDSPDIKPDGCGTPFNEPSSLPLVASTAASLLGMRVEEIVEMTFKNAARVFERQVER
jgi:TatD DNase family protein